MNVSQNAVKALRNISAQDFQSFGVEQVAYLKPVTVENRNAYALYAADGRFLTLQDSANLALMVARHNGLDLMAVH